MPRVFVFSSHGSMQVTDDKTSFALPVMGMKGDPKLKLKKVVLIASPVDTFTAAKFGDPFCADLRCDAPYVELVRNLSESVRSGSMRPDMSKNDLRQLIKRTMVDVRDHPRHADARKQAENKIRCHRLGRTMTDLFLFDPSQAVPIIESVTMVDMQTGKIEDVHREFGLAKKSHATKRKVSTDGMGDAKKRKVSADGMGMGHAAQSTDDAAILQDAKSRAEAELVRLKTHRSDPFYIDMKTEHIKSIDDTLKCMHPGSKFEYSAKTKKVYKDRIKLSDLLRIGISSGLVDPENDFVVVYACRVPDDGTLGAQPSPRAGSDSERSVGGKKYKRSRNKTCKQRPT